MAGYTLLSIILALSTLFLSFKSNYGVLFFIALISVLVFSYTFLYNVSDKPSNIEIEMNSIYEHDYSLIPISVKVTGFNNDLFVGLFQENESYNLNMIEEKQIPINTVDRMVEHGDYLIGNYLNAGNYVVYINTTGLENGYYEICFNVASTSKTQSKGFYLVDD
jgi:ABC-type transport system involved in multi-copper enzyme maturation permease subunit